MNTMETKSPTAVHTVTTDTTKSSQARATNENIDELMTQSETKLWDIIVWDRIYLKKYCHVM